MAETALDIELVNKPLVKAWAWWALVWLTVFPFVGILVSIQFHNPEFLGGMPWFTFGRLRSVHLGGVLFGSFTTAFIGLLYYFVPRLCGTPLYKVEWGWWLLWMWNAFLVLGSLTLFMGYGWGGVCRIRMAAEPHAVCRCGDCRDAGRRQSASVVVGNPARIVRPLEGPHGPLEVAASRLGYQMRGDSK